MAAAASSGGAGREKTRTITSHGARIEETGKIGGELKVQKDAPFLDARLAIWESFKAADEAARASESRMQWPRPPDRIGDLWNAPHCG
jgi:hypothetical protein